MHMLLKREALASSRCAKGLAHLHATVVIEELRRCGVGVFCLSPGARAIPLVLALQDNPRVVTKLFNDERSAAFWAQGAAKAGRLPCLICTSGTAAANYLPAVAEASLAGVPLLLLTTDRPFELHYAKANQTLPQRDLFAAFAQLAIDVPAPERRLYLHALLADLDQAVFEARHMARPVHLNLAYRKPFIDEAFSLDSLPAGEVAELDRWLARDTPYCDYLLPQPRLTAPDAQRVVERISAADNIVCVAGPLAPTSQTTALGQLATHLAAPVLADINSGLRCDGHPAYVLALYNLYLRRAVARLPAAELVLYFGDRIVSEPLREYLEAQDAEFILCSSYPLRQDAIENEFIYPTMKICGDPDGFAAELLAALPSRQPGALAHALTTCESDAQRQLAALLGTHGVGPLTEGRVIYEVFQHIHDDSAVFLSASLIFREAEYFVPGLQKTLHVGANRGATGIDGVLSSAIGFGEGLAKPCTVLIGDQALLHDLNALALLAETSVPMQVIVINNHSGAIFHFFDLGETGARLRNPHPWNFRGVAENFHLPYVRPTSLASFVAAYREAQAQRRSSVFEIVVDGEASVRLFQAASSA
ncbi:MAG TPA: 2-succinyl-5-enolpyruvyl-6-hydroxy-3-cyclohexene-1-carboxylic-acid synthase [Candidatus Tectomicrobia bacterium]|nr:2-succinyl-5-enolpyruvyl-6-hydroxy-3-cyclohexene-1-carboxylic-acid synthase [Candidatus Tectomicrobia bacterium]